MKEFRLEYKDRQLKYDFVDFSTYAHIIVLTRKDDYNKEEEFEIEAKLKILHEHSNLIIRFLGAENLDELLELREDVEEAMRIVSMKSEIMHRLVK